MLGKLKLQVLVEIHQASAEILHEIGLVKSGHNLFTYLSYPQNLSKIQIG